MTPVEAANKLGPNPHFVIDGQASDKSTMQTINAKDIASLRALHTRGHSTRIIPYPAAFAGPNPFL